jgi:hypothetical protein
VDVAENDSANRKEPAMNKSSKIRIRTAALLATTGAVAAFTLTGAASPVSASEVPGATATTQVIDDSIEAQVNLPAEEADADQDWVYSEGEVIELNKWSDTTAAALQAAGIPVVRTTDANGIRWADVDSTDEAVLEKAAEVCAQVDNAEFADDSGYELAGDQLQGVLD